MNAHAAALLHAETGRPLRSQLEELERELVVSYPHVTLTESRELDGARWWRANCSTCPAVSPWRPLLSAALAAAGL